MVAVSDADEEPAEYYIFSEGVVIATVTTEFIQDGELVAVIVSSSLTPPVASVVIDLTIRDLRGKVRALIR